MRRTVSPWQGGDRGPEDPAVRSRAWNGATGGVGRLGTRFPCSPSLGGPQL